jgi:predicted acylesterase/phospholipase RssA
MESSLPEALILGPGGAKSFLELGALLVLEERQLLNDVNTIVGVSTGSIIGILMCVGYTIQEIISICMETDLFQDLESYVIHSERRRDSQILSRKKELERRISDKIGFVPTLYGLYCSTGIRFVITTLNVTKKKIEYLCYRSDPNLSCLDAVFLSISIPFLFFQMKYKDNLYIDGAFGDPYPLSLFNEERVLGIYIKRENKPIERSNPLGHLLWIIQSIMDMNRCRNITEYNKNHYQLELSDSEEEETDMIASGYSDALNFINKSLPDLTRNNKEDCVYIESNDPIPLLSAFLAEHPELQSATGAILEMSKSITLESKNT